MIQLLSHAKNWYIDATFKVVRHPFTQLLSIHAFTTSGVSTKQVPLLFVIMSGKSKQDYKRVLKAVIKLLPSIRVETITIDFEAAMWKAIHRVLPTMQIFGCFFHWAQVVWRKVQALGLQSAYTSDNATHKYIKKLMSLPYLPAAYIQPIFNKLQQKAATPSLLELTSYIETTWLNSTVWSMRSWSVFGHHTRTNNDVEGWHHCLNKKARKGQLPFYILIPSQHEEAKKVSIQVHLVSESKLTRQECLKYCNNQSSVFKGWEDYINRNKTPSQLLKACSKLVPFPN